MSEVRSGLACVRDTTDDCVNDKSCAITPLAFITRKDPTASRLLPPPPSMGLRLKACPRVSFTGTKSSAILTIASLPTTKAPLLEAYSYYLATSS